MKYISAVLVITLSICCAKAQSLPVIPYKPKPTKTKAPPTVVKPVRKQPVVPKRTPPAEPVYQFVQDRKYDDFSGIILPWESDLVSVKKEVLDGKLKFTNPYPDRRVSFYQNFDEIDLSRDFSCSVTVRWAEGASGASFGLYVCSAYEYSNLFFIASVGNYGIAYNDAVGAKLLKEWTYSAVINKGAAANILQVRKQGDLLHYSINGTEVDTVPFRPGTGRRFGMDISGGQTVYFDDFELKGTFKTRVQ